MPTDRRRTYIVVERLGDRSGRAFGCLFRLGAVRMRGFAGRRFGASSV